MSPIIMRCPVCQARPGEPCTIVDTEGTVHEVKWFHELRERRLTG